MSDGMSATTNLESEVAELRIRLARAEKELAHAAQSVRSLVERFTPRPWGWRLRHAVNYLCGIRLPSFFQHAPRRLRPPASYFRVAPPNPAPTISIVTPSFRQEKFIERTIRSVLDQNYPRLEYVVQDGGSEDGTVDVLKSYEKRLFRWTSAKDKGQANAINLGFEGTSGEIMAYLNSDDLLAPGSLNYVAQFFAQHPEVDAVYGHRWLIDECDHLVGSWVMPPHRNEDLLYADYVPQETLFWRRRIWEKVGGIDDGFQFAMDWDLLLRFIEAGAKIVRLPRFLGMFRVHEAQKTQAMNTVGLEEMERLRRRTHGRLVPLEEANRRCRGFRRRHGLYHNLYLLGLNGR